jgi:murein L,D-transpeptidase YcbB/YkuD
VNSKLVLTVLSATAVFIAVPESAHAGLFGCGKKCQARKAAEAEYKRQQDEYARQQQDAYARQQAEYQRQQQEAYARQQAEYQRQQQEWQRQQQEAYQRSQQGYGQQGGYGGYQQPSYQQPSYQQPSYQTQPSYQPSYGNRYGDPYATDYQQNYGQLTNQDWLQFQSTPYGYQPTPLMGAAYDKTPYQVAINDPQVQQVIQGTIAKGQDIEIGDATIDASLVNKFYSLRGYQPAFVTTNGLLPQAQVAKDLFVNKSKAKGLDPRDYWSPEMEARFNNPNLTPAQRAGLDLLMAQSYVRLAGDLMNGRTNPALVDSYVMIKKRAFNEYQALNNTLRNGVDQLAAIESFEPQHADYKKLLQVLQSLTAIKANGGWPKISGVKVLKVGVSSPDVPLVRARLMELNLLPFSTTVDPSQAYDQTLSDAVKQFQWDHKLKPDGVIGPQGFAVLNTSVDERIKETRATLEKWRWLPRNLGSRYIMVNIARQEMQVIENGQVVMSMKTVNGQVLRPTNILIDQIVSVDLNPYWNPPPSLILADVMPKQRADSDHLAEERVKIFGLGKAVRTVGGGSQVFASGSDVNPKLIDWSQYKNTIPALQFREEPGIRNSLGVVKFQTTNAQAIYLHDTNHREFFDNYDERYLSSGCIRLQKPLDLLQYLLRSNPEGNSQNLDQILSLPNAYTHKVIKLGKDAIPFYVFYGTVSFDENGRLRFARDAYNLDERIVRALTPQSDKL